MKTVFEIVQEYLNRQKNPEYLEIAVMTDAVQHIGFDEVTNLKKTKDEDGRWIEFDYVIEYYVPPRKNHAKLKGTIIKKITAIDEK